MRSNSAGAQALSGCNWMALRRYDLLICLVVAVRDMFKNLYDSGQPLFGSHQVLVAEWYFEGKICWGISKEHMVSLVTR